MSSIPPVSFLDPSLSYFILLDPDVIVRVTIDYHNTSVHSVICKSVALHSQHVHNSAL